MRNFIKVMIIWQSLSTMNNRGKLCTSPLCPSETVVRSESVQEHEPDYLWRREMPAVGTQFTLISLPCAYFGNKGKEVVCFCVERLEQTLDFLSTHGRIISYLFINTTRITPYQYLLHLSSKVSCDKSERGSPCALVTCIMNTVRVWQEPHTPGSRKVKTSVSITFAFVTQCGHFLSFM